MFTRQLAKAWYWAIPRIGLRRFFVSAPESIAGVKSILLVCKGNICRSAYAAERLRMLFRGVGRDDIRVTSAGLETTPGHTADPPAVEIARQRGVNLSAHRTETIAEALAEKPELILTMERWQQRLLYERFSRESFLLGTFGASCPPEVPDPFGGAPCAFEECFVQIDEALEGLTRHILSAAEKRS